MTRKKEVATIGLRLPHKKHSDQEEGGESYRQATSRIQITTFDPQDFLSAHPLPALATFLGLGAVGGRVPFLLLPMWYRAVEGVKRGEGKSWRGARKLVPATSTV